uniref:Gingipain domain-containing protein n=1 Tax=candidate division WOR-3 bacterium TaxID=2052148 RepID=A0A7V3PSW8_UNCW3
MSLLFLIIGFSVHTSLISPDQLQVEIKPDSTDMVTSVLIPLLTDRLPEVVKENDCAIQVRPPMIAGGVEVAQLIISQLSSTGTKLTFKYPAPLTAQHAKNLMPAFLFPWLPVPNDKNELPGYLIIVPDEFYSNILPLARWKERKGFKVWVKKTSETGIQRDQIRAYIQNAYQNWSPAPSYVLLVGAINKIPAFPTPGATSCVTDHTYGCVDGNDYLADIFIGRLPAANSSELDCMVAKIIGYESAPYYEDTLWYQRALMVGTSYQEGGTPAVTALVTKRIIREQLLSKGFTKVDTVFYPPTPSGRGPVDTAVNQGVLLINGRGWGQATGWNYPQYQINDVYNLNNGWKLPVVTSIYCGTGNYQANPCFGEAWLRAGTPTMPKGGVAFWGASYTGTSTRWNNCMDYGIYNAIFEKGVTTIGPAMYAGKIEQLLNFPLPQDSADLIIYFHVYNLLGDPALELWTTVPKLISVIHPLTYSVGTSQFTVRVTDVLGNPVKDAQVCLYKTNEVQTIKKTDAFGNASFTISTTTSDTLFVTVTGKNIKSYLGFSIGQTRELLLGYRTHTPDTVYPGTTPGITITIKNYGTGQTAYGIQGILTALDTFCAISDSIRNYGTLAPGQEGATDPFYLTISPACTTGQRLPLRLKLTSGDSTWFSDFNLTVCGPRFEVRKYIVYDGNGYLDPGETADLALLIKNRGDRSATQVTGILHSSNPWAITISDSVGTFGTINAGDSVMNETDRFQLDAAPGIALGRRFTIYLDLTGPDGFRHRIDFPITVGEPVSFAPLGPDHYGYWGYDDTDTAYQEHPEFSWCEIDPSRGGSGTRINIGNDRAVPINIPFTFRYYGREYQTISVSDNGYLAFGTTWWGEPYNWIIPSAQGPDGFLAVFWDDFRTDTLNAGGVFYYYDEPQHRLIVEWSNVYHIHGFRPPIIAEQQTFQAILYDPIYYPTRTGDGPILYQYLNVQNDDSLLNNNHNFATVGIQSPDHADGLLWTFADSYPPAAVQILPCRVIKFTTNPPDTFTSVAEPRAECNINSIKISPTVVSKGIWIQISSLTDELTVELIDITGRVLSQIRLNNPLANKCYFLKLNDSKALHFKNGIFILQLINPVKKTRILTKKIIIAN